MARDRGLRSGDVLEHGTLSRNYDPAMFMAHMDVDGAGAKPAVRKALNRLDSGRFVNVLDAGHRHFARADLAGRDDAAELYGPTFLRWLAVYGRSQDLLWRPLQEAAGEVDA
jgi:hypothetical protein